MKYFIISQPKAGTYLCANLLQEFGIAFEGLHFTLNKYQRYDLNNLEDCRKNRSKYSIKSPIEESIKLIKNRQVGVGHLNYDNNTENLLKDFKKILLVRDKTSSITSWKKWAKITGKSSNSELITQGKRVGIENWNNKENVFTLSFYDMINVNLEKINNLQIFLFDKLISNSEIAMKIALKKDSLTKVEK